MKKIALTIIIIFFTTFAAAEGGWGVITEDKQTEIGNLDNEYTLGLVNTHNEPITLILSSTTDSDYNITFEKEEITLEPSYTTENPQGEGWFYRGHGEYVNVTYTSFKFETHDERTTNSINFNVSAQTAPEQTDTAESISEPQIVDQRNFEYEVDIDKMLLQGVEPNDEREERDWTEPDNATEDRDMDEEEERSTEEANNTENITDDEENDLEEERQLVDITTIMLLVLIMLMVFYILK